MLGTVLVCVCCAAPHRHVLVCGEGRGGDVKLNEIGGPKLERQNSCQWAKHSKLYSNQVWVLGETLIFRPHPTPPRGMAGKRAERIGAEANGKVCHVNV